MAPLDPPTQELQRRLRYDTPFWAGGVHRAEDGNWVYPKPPEWQGAVKIVNKQRRLVPCIAKPWQLDLDGLLEKQRAAGLPMRAIILKARKLGFSTWIAVKMLQRVTQFEWQGAIVTAQDTDTAGVIFDMAKTAYSHLPNEQELGLGFSIKPAIIGSSFSKGGRKYLQFGEPSRKLRMEGRTGESIFEIDTAGSPEAGRGYTPNLLHLSEVARWEGEQATRKMLSQLNAVPPEPETLVVLESTANGLNHFHRRWVAARDGAGDPETGETYVALFVPWWRDPGCAKRFATEGQRESFVAGIGDENRFGEVAEDEEALIEAYALTAEQLFWRRMMIRTQHEGNVQLFKQENPASDEEAFIGSGRTFFSSILISKAIRAAEAAPEPVVGSLKASGWETKRSRAGTIEIPTGAIWVPADAMGGKDHKLEVWEHPRAAPEEEPDRPVAQPPTAGSSEELLRAAAELAEREGAQASEHLGAYRAGAYIIGADIAEGEVNTFTEGDLHAVQVFDHHSHMQVALHESRMDLHDLPLWLLLIALYYNNATLGIEVNGPGIAVVDPLHKDYHYPRMYRRKRIDTTTRQEVKKPGWKTDQVSKPAMEATFGGALADDTHGLRDLKTARQLATYVVDERGRTGATHGEHDDRLVAAMIATRIMETTRAPKPRKGRKLREPSDPLTGY